MIWTPEKQQAIEAGARALVNWAAGQESRYHSDRLGGHAKAVVIVGMWFGHLEAVNDTEWGEIVRAARDSTLCNGRLNRCQCHQPIPPVRFYALRGDDGHCSECRWEFDPLALFSALLLEGLAKGEQETGHPYRPETPCANCGGHPYSKHQWDTGDRSVGMDGSEWCEALGCPEEVESPCSCVRFDPAAPPSWFDGHAAFEVTSPSCRRCGHRAAHLVGLTGCGQCGCQYPTFSRPFIIPPLTFTYDDGAAA